MSDQNRPLAPHATLNEARRMLVDTNRCSISLAQRVENLDIETERATVERCREQLNAARRASLAGHLFIIDHATLADDWSALHAECMTLSSIRSPFDGTVILTPNHEGASCPLFVATRGVSDHHSNLFTAMPLKNDEMFFWGVPGFAAGQEKACSDRQAGLLTAIKVRNLKPIGPPR